MSDNESITVVEIDVDEYRLTQFETTVASASPDRWASVWGGSSALVGVASVSYPSGKGLRITNTGAARRLWRWTLPSNFADASAVMGVIGVPTVGERAGIVLRGAGSGASGSGYIALLEDNATLTVASLKSGTYAELASADIAVVDSDLVWIRLDTVDTTTGVVVRAKAWAGGLNDEPALFTVSAEDTSSPITPAGYSGIYKNDAGSADVVHFRVRSYLGDTLQTLRYAMPTASLSPTFDAIPNCTSVSHSPMRIALGESLGKRATVTVTFSDHLAADRGELFERGTYWGKLRARALIRRGVPMRIKRGLADQQLDDFETRHYVVESFNGPTVQGTFSVTAQDVLKLADNDRAQAPAMNNGFLVASITNSATTLTLSPSGIGASEYPRSGYAAIGGEEIVSFTRKPSADSQTVLLFHANGTNGSTTFTDSSAAAHVITGNGNAQITTGQSKFGGASLSLDGTDDWVRLDGSADFAFGTGDFTVDMWCRLTALGSQRVLYDSRPAATNGLYPTILVNASNKVIFHTNSADRITGTTSVSANTWFHVVLARQSGATKLFLNGVQEGTDYTDANNYLNGAQRPTIGTNGHTVTSDEVIGQIDEVEVSKGAARYFAAFTSPTVETSSASGDILDNLVRAQYGTTAVAHDSEDRVQVCLRYAAQTPATIIYDLLVNYAGVDAAAVPLAAWELECSTYLQRVYTRLIAEPTGVNKLVSELIEQAGLAVWTDDSLETGQIRLQVLRGIDTSAFTYDRSSIVQGSTQVQEQPNTRLTQVWSYYGVRNPLKSLSEPNNYRSSLYVIDGDAETLYGSAIIRKIHGTWIPTFGRTTAERVNLLLLSRFTVPPRKFMFDVMRYSGVPLPQMGAGYNIKYWGGQDEAGNEIPVPIQVTQINPQGERVRVEAEEMRVTSFAAVDLTARTIIIDGNINNFDLKSAHDAIYPALAGDTTGITITCIIGAGVVVGSDSASAPAFSVGDFPATGESVEIEVLGRIQGAGGAGGSVTAGGQTAGVAGGTALYTRQAVTLTYTGGEIWGGGGGGGTSYVVLGQYVGAGGGGGAGTIPGAGGASTSGITSGASGTDTAGGAGGAGGSIIGGLGGAPGAAGSVGSGANNGTPGVGGAAIDGISYVTVSGAPGDTQGSQIN